jgi:EAL domain-containing protein (putative c-di-GMP-specific phosphodiesterase class I)
MSLQDLTQHFNDLLKQQQKMLPHLPNTYFYWREGQFFARFGSQDFGNQFIPIVAREDKQIMGYESRLWVRTALGSAIPVGDVFDALTSLDEVVFLDRITRTLQALNFSVLPEHRGSLLSLGIQPRHILGVSSGHGRTFDTILGDCGLATAKVLLHTHIPTPEHFAHFRRALFSYSAFGYRVGTHVYSAEDWARYKAWGLKPDYLFLNEHFSPAYGALEDLQIICPSPSGLEWVDRRH